MKTNKTWSLFPGNFSQVGEIGIITTPQDKCHLWIMNYLLYKPRVKRPHPRNVTRLSYCSAPSVTFVIILLGLLSSSVTSFLSSSIQVISNLTCSKPQNISQVSLLNSISPAITLGQVATRSCLDHHSLFYIHHSCPLQTIFHTIATATFSIVNHINRSICLKTLHSFTFTLRIKFIYLIKAYESSSIYFLLTSQILYVVYFCLRALDKLALVSEL